MGFLLKKEDALTVLLTGYGILMDRYGQFSIFLELHSQRFRVQALNLVLWTSSLELGPWDLEETFCNFFVPGLLLRVDTEGNSAPFDLG